jgi:hypothetical protein
VAGEVTHDRDLRSLDRPRLRGAFGPLDAEERLPRELVIDHGIAWRGVGKRMVALLWPSVLLAGLLILAWVAGLRSG